MEQLNKYFLILSCALLVSCSTVRDKVSDVQSKVFNGNFAEAVTSIDNNKFLKKDKNRLLFLMEKGKIEHLNGNYDASNALLEQAYIMIDDKIKTNVGQAIASKLTSPLAEPYKGEDFEKVMIHYYKALNFYYLGQDESALVEAKRINNVLNDMNVKYEDKKNLYQTDVFSHILQGLIHENLNEFNDAYISYKNAVDIFLKDKDKQYFGVQIPYQLQTDFLRMCLKMNFKNEFEQYKTKFQYKDKIDVKSPKSELVVLWENGTGPYKSENKLTLAGGMFVNDDPDGESFAFPVPVGLTDVSSVAIPKYMPGETFYDQATISYENKNFNLEKVQDLYPIAKQCLKDRMGRELTSMITRFASKKVASEGIGAIGNKLFGGLGGSLTKLGANFVGAGLEKADTRNWQLLPANISYTRIPIKNDSIVIVNRIKNGEIAFTEKINIKPFTGIKLINLYDLGNSSLTSTNINSASIKTIPTQEKDNSIVENTETKIPVKITNDVDNTKSNLRLSEVVNAVEVSNVSSFKQDDSQYDQEEEPNYKISKFGIFLGMNIPSLTDKDDIDDEMARTGLNFNIGLEYLKGFNKFFAAKIRLMYSMEGGNFYNLDYDLDYKIDYIRTEFLANIDIAPQKFYLHAGPSIGYAVTAQIKDNIEGDSIDLVDALDGFDANFNKIEYGLNFGLGAVIKKKVFIEASYHLGLSPIISGGDWITESGDDNENKNRVLNFKMGYRF